MADGIGDNQPFCMSLNDNDAPISVLENETVTIDGIPCDGKYKIEFYSAYPEYDIDNDGINDNGGIIPQFTLEYVSVHCGSIEFGLPKLGPKFFLKV